MIGQALQHNLECPTGLTGPEQGNVEAAKHRALFFHRVGQRRAFLDALADVAE